MKKILCAFITLLLIPSALFAVVENARPNIVFILADDMGYGDPHCFNPQSKCLTPHIDRLASQGMRFTDAHAAGSVCVPSRYGLLTGRLPFRRTSLNPAKEALVEPGRMTIASLLHDQGYSTAMIGKWHLGFDGGDAFDYSKPLRGGPFDHGFDSFFGQHASLDIPPYFFIANDRCVAGATRHMEESHSPDWSPIQGAFWRAGAIAPDFEMDDVMPTYTRKAVKYLEERKQSADGAKPFFLYLAFTAPHTPWIPTEAFRGKSAGNLYADWVAQVDDATGQALAALDRAGLSDNTLVFFSSDNGPVWYPEDVLKYGHSAVGPLRGMKGDAFEGGHRMPFISRWPGKIKAGATSGQLICFADMLATFGTAQSDNPGRLQCWNLQGMTVLLDYAHNPEGLAGLLGVAAATRGAGRLGLLLGQAGNRGEEDIRALARTTAAARPDLVVLKDLDAFLRGRVPGEVPAILQAELIHQGFPVAALVTILPEADAARALLAWGRAGDILVLPVHSPAAREQLTPWLDALKASEWVPGTALPEFEIRTD